MSCGCPASPNQDCKISPPRRTVEKIRDPTPEPIVKREVRRNPTPPPDIIERVNFFKQILLFIIYYHILIIIKDYY